MLVFFIFLGPSPLRMDEAPSHRTDLIEEVCGLLRLGSINHSGTAEETQEGVDFLRGTIGDTPVIESISAKPAVAFTQVCRN